MEEVSSARRRWFRFSIRDVGFATALCAVCLGWWADRHLGTRANEPSPAFDAFDIAQILENVGFQVEQQVDGQRTTNSASGRAEILAAGTFAAPADGFACFSVFQLVSQRLNAAAENHTHHEGWIPTAACHPGKPVRICTFYNQGDRHGELHLWLFSNEDESRIGYSLHLGKNPCDSASGCGRIAR